MFHTKTLITLAVLGLILTAGIVTTYAFQGNPQIQGPNYSPERHEQMLEAFENNDFDAWQKLMQNMPIADKITSDNFGQFKAVHQAMLDGDMDKAHKLREELGLDFGHRGMMAGSHGSHMGGHMGEHAGQGNRQFIDENNDGVCDHFDEE